METLVDILSQSAQRWADLPATRLHGAVPWEWSHAELWDAARRTAAHLADQGVGHGDRVLLWGANRPEWVAGFFGVLALGAVAVPLDMRSETGFAQRIVERAEPRHLLLGKEQARRLAGASAPATVLDDLRATLAPITPLSADAVRVDPGDLAELVYTSGTTGNPKGVMLTHRNVVSNTTMARTAIEPTTRHRALSILPLSHMFEQTSGLFAPLAGGASITYIGSLRPDVIFEAMGRYRITHMSCVPQVLQLFRDGVMREVRKQGREQQFERLMSVAGRLPIPARRLIFRQVLRRMGGAFEFFVSGGAYLDPDLGRWWERIGIKVVQGYGMTEAAPIVATNSLVDRDVTTVGRVVPGVELVFAEDGEILVRGDNISPGYWQDPVATAAAFDDGWYRTGDLGSLDPSGRLRLRGRKKDVIVLANGMNVYPEDVERVLMSEPGVKGAVALGQTTGQDVQVHAVLLLERGVEDADAIVRHANAGLSPHQQIRGHTVWPDDSFPLTPTLKVRRAEVMTRLPELRTAPARTRARAAEPAAAAASSQQTSVAATAVAAAPARQEEPMASQDPAAAPPADEPTAHTLSNGQQIALPPHDQFYAQFVVRNRGLVSPDEQEALRRATILVAGCGSIGGAVVEPLVRLGAERLILAEPGDYDLHNLNRQAVRLQDLGRNKAEVFQERMRDINPYAEISVDTRGIVAENVEALVAQATIIVDGVDVTTRPPLWSKYALHEQAQRRGIPVISGYDIAGLQLLRIYDYRKPGVAVMDGRVRPDGPELREPMVFLRRVIPIGAVPLEIIGELQQQLRGSRDGFPQIVYTANLFGVITLQAILDILGGRRVRREVIVDVPTLLRPRSVRLRVAASRLYGLYHLNNAFRRTLRQTRDPEELPHAVGGP